VSKRAAIYLRISLDKHGDGLAVDRQKADCIRVVTERGWTLTEIYEDASLSAFKKNVKRPAYDRLIADMRAGKFDAVVSWDLDRLTRQPRQLEDFIDMGEAGTLTLVTVDSSLDLSTDNGRMFARIKAGVARAEMERKSARQKAKNSQNVALGRPVPGRRRFGFEPGNIVERADEAERVRWAFTQMIDGGSIFAIAKELGKPPVRVREILTNPGYAGWVVRKGERFEASPEVARIVDRDTFEKVQVLLADPTRKTSPGNQVKYLASGIARCGVCGARMVKQSGNYLCKGNLGHPTITVASLDEHLKWEAFTYVASQNATGTGEVAALVGDLTELMRQRAAWQEQATWEGADLSRIKTEVARLSKAIERTESELASVRASSVIADVATALRSEMTDAEGEEWWNDRWDSLTLESRRQLLANLDIRVANGRGIERVSVTPR
jgi:DNA invertase Pin-like site-specific DNA recombinase